MGHDMGFGKWRAAWGGHHRLGEHHGLGGRHRLRGIELQARERHGRTMTFIFAFGVKF
jgi:hypothetical protein